MKTAVSVIIFIASVLFGFAFLLEWTCHRKEFSAFNRLGITFSILYLVLEVLLVLLCLDPPDDFFSFDTLELVVRMLFDCFKLYVTLTLGCYYAHRLGYPVFPLLKSYKNVFKTQPNWANLAIYVLSVSLVVALSTTFSYALFRTVPFDISEGLFGDRSPTLRIAIVTSFGPALFEEIVFRLGIQNYLAKMLKLGDSRYWVAIVLASALWTMAHINVMDIYWIKFIQVFPYGLLLGWLNKKYGTESAILAHGLANLSGNLVLLPLS